MKTTDNVILEDMCKEGRELKWAGSASGKEKLVRAGWWRGKIRESKLSHFL